MSLINKVLNDLEQQKKAQPKQPEEVLSGLEVVTTGKHKNQKLKIIFLIVILIVLAIILIYKFTPARRNIQTSVDKVEIQVKKAIPAIPKKTTTDETKETAQPQIVVKEEPFVTIKQLNVNSKNNEFFLTIQLDKEAHYQIEHSQDNQKLSIELTNTQLDKNIQPVDLSNSPIKSLNFKQENTNLFVHMSLLLNTEIRSIDMVPDGGAYALKVGLFNADLQTLIETKVQKKEVPLSVEQQVEQQYQNAIELLSNNQTDEAVKSLYGITSDFPNYLPARVTLVKILFQNNQLQEANRVLNQGLVQSSSYVPFVKLKAHILVKQGKTNEALKVLEEAAPSIREDPDYYAFIAALYQQKGQYLIAARLYDQLVKIRPERGMWWAGLGIALDSAGKKNAAAEAYQNALQGDDVSPQMRAYIQSRMDM